MGRCGSHFVSAEETLAPDLITIAKGLGAGYQPIGAVLASEAVIAPIAAGTGVLAHGQTFMGHAVACAAALAVLDTIANENLLASVRQQGALLELMLRDAFGQHPHVGDIRGRGLLWGLEFVRNRATREPFDASAELAKRIKLTAQRLGLICYPSSGTVDGRIGDHVVVAPPFVIRASELEELVTKLLRTIDSELRRTAAN
jgi:adenosylmethionine-8-amino-7-oxononanoate aminotransferase